MGRALGVVAGIAAAYLATGWAGLGLALPPGYSTPVWVPSGIALGALLVAGGRAWPGVFLGSGLLNLCLSLDRAPLGTALLTASGIGAGASLQALAGTWLLQRFCGQPLALARERDVLRFMLLAGPVSCLVSASIAMGTLAAAGAVSAAQIPFSWMTWWMGDAIGAVTVAPLVLIAGGRPRQLWRRRLVGVGIPLVAMFGASTVFFIRTSAWEEGLLRGEFEDRAKRVTDEIRTRVERCRDVVQGVRWYFGASRDVDAREFAAYTGPSLLPEGGIQALEWAPRVGAAQRSSFEAAQQDLGKAGYAIWERSPDGRRVPAAPRLEHFPVHFLEPLQGNEAAVGYDLASERVRLEALQRARDTGEPASTAPLVMLQDPARGRGFLIASPIYRAGASPLTVEERRELLQGFSVGVVYLHGLMEAAWKAGEAEGLRLRIQDASLPGETLWSRGPEPREPLAKRLGLQVSLDVAGRPWTLSWNPSMDSLISGRSWMAWSVLVAGLLFASLVSAHLLVSSGREAAIGEIVSVRTAELSRANLQLAAEVEERRRSENALRQSEERFRSLSSSSPIGIFHADTKGRCLYTNARLQQITGQSPEESLGDGWMEALHPEDRGRVLRKWTAAVAKGVEVQDEFRCVRPSGEVRWVAVRAAPLLSEEGRLAGYVGTDEDVTERREIDRMKREFISIVSHELRTPITAINGSLGLIAGGATGPISTQGAILVEIAKRNCERLVRLINDILDMEKIEAGKMPFRMEPLTVDRLVARAIEAHRAIGVPKDVRLAFVNEAPGVEIKADEDRLSQVVVNLLSNAIKFSPRGEAVTVALRTHEGGIRLSVADRGPGIPEAFRARIFEKFLQADSSDAREKGGTGLGLAICKAIVEKHGGKIGFDSAPGRGTAFLVDLPFAPADSSTQRIPVWTPAAGVAGGG